MFGFVFVYCVDCFDLLFDFIVVCVFLFVLFVLCICAVVIIMWLFCYVVCIPPTASNIFIHSSQGHPVLLPLSFHMLQEVLRVRQGLVVLQMMHEAQGCIKGLHFH